MRRLLSRTSLATCENKEIKAKTPPSFYIDKQQPQFNDYKWVAVLDPSVPEPNVLGFLDAEKGQRNYLKTNEGSQKCGIGKALMEFCLNDDDITEDGGINSLTSPSWRDDNLGPIAKEMCRSIVYVDCEPLKPTPKMVCKSYMEAARDAGYQMMFVEKLVYPEEVIYDRLRIDRAYPIFVEDPEQFIVDRGNFWYFCKCKPTKRGPCLGNLTNQFFY